MDEQKNNFFIPASIILAGFVIAGGIYLSNRGDSPIVKVNTTKSSGVIVNPVSKTDHILGNPDALVTIVEFSDTECPYCKMFQTTMKTIIDIYGKDGEVAWVYRHFPLDSLHSKSRKEAEATECVNELGGNTAFWKMLDTIYEKTPANDGLNLEKLPEFAKEAGVDVTKFNTCLSSGKYAQLIQDQLEDGVKAGAQGTPFSVMILKNKLSDSTETIITNYIIKNGLAQNVTISGTKKEITLNGALPIDIMKALIDAIVN